ncbi:uncharacterized protein LOC135433573 [Drosophila montana]|uniref:uncharacterized protein LOC135433573 n=1 Tax=Drosophila montana TaxID=40370 RepID=UPI00313C389A
MKLTINLLLQALLIGLLALSQLPYGNAKALVSTSAVTAIANATESMKTNLTNQNATIVVARDTDRSNDTAVTTLPTQTKSLEMSQSQSTGSTVLTNIVRRKRQEVEPTLPFDSNTMHLPCDLDHNGRAQVVEAYPNHCIWVWNNKYVHEGFFRVFKIYQLESFFFGQYYERFKRFEIDPHDWDYSNIVF